MKRTNWKDRIAVTFWVDPVVKLAMERESELNWSAVLRNAVDQKLENLRVTERNHNHESK